METKLFATREITGVCPVHGAWVEQFPERISYNGANLCRPCSEQKFKDETNARLAQEQRDRKAARIRDLMQGSEIPAIHDGAPLIAKNKRHDDQLDHLRRFIADFPAEAMAGRSFLLYGTTGTGKSSAAAAVLRDVAEQHLAGVLFARQAEIGMRIRQAMTGQVKGETEFSIVKRFEEIDLLCIDELGVGKNTEAEVTTIADLICSRHEHLMPTIVTSNKSLDELHALFGDRLRDRFNARNWTWLSFAWASYRGAKAAA